MKIFKKKRNVLIAIAVLFCIIFCMSFMIKRINEAKKIKNWKKQYLDMAVKVDESVKLGGYTFRLKNACYDTDGKSGYCYIEVESDKKNVRNLHLRDKNFGTFANKDGDREFGIYLYGNRTQEVHSCFYHDKLCILIFYDAVENDTDFDLTISLDDFHETKINVYYPKRFSRKYIGDYKGEIWVTQHEIKMDYFEEEIENLIIVLKNGKEKVLIKDDYLLGKSTSVEGTEDVNKRVCIVYYGEICRL